MFLRAFFCEVSLCIVFQTFHSENRSVFLQNLPNLSLRGGHFQCPTRQSETGRNGIPERGTAKPARCRLATNQNFGITSFCAPVLRHGMPYLWLKDCHVAALLAMTQNWDGFICKTDVFYFCGYFFRSIAPHRLSNVSLRKLFRFSEKPTKFVIARRARAPDAAIFNGSICHSVTNYGRTERSRTLKS